MEVSVFRTVGIGRIDSNKELNSKTVDVVPIEWLPMRDGELTGNETAETYQTKDIDGNAVSGGMISSNSISATWLPSGSNRLTAPDVRRGERVEILQTADHDKYYWRTMGLDDNLRKLETIIFGISATQDEGSTTLGIDNMYWFELSSHSKMFSFRSCQANGEPYLYEMFFDFAEGTFTVKDDIGNFMFLASALNLIHLQNAKGTFVKLDQMDIKAYAPQDINAKADRDFIVSAGKNIRMKAGVEAVIDGGGSVMTMNAGSTTLKTPKFVGKT